MHLMKFQINGNYEYLVKIFGEVNEINSNFYFKIFYLNVKKKKNFYSKFKI